MNIEETAIRSDSKAQELLKTLESLVQLYLVLHMINQGKATLTVGDFDMGECVAHLFSPMESQLIAVAREVDQVMPQTIHPTNLEEQIERLIVKDPEQLEGLVRWLKNEQLLKGVPIGHFTQEEWEKYIGTIRESLKDYIQEIYPKQAPTAEVPKPTEA